MSEDVYTLVDGYLEDLFGHDPALQSAVARSNASGLPGIQVSPTLGRFLHVLALARGARSILEIGTLGGYSAIWLARALPPGGRVTSLELDPRHAEVARQNIMHAGLQEEVVIRVGDALELLSEMEKERAGPFDMVFIDADKPAYAEYLTAALRLSGPGTLIVADNVVRRGKVADPQDDPEAVGVAKFNARLAADSRLGAAVIQLVGVKGHDGMALAVVRESASWPDPHGQ